MAADDLTDDDWAFIRSAIDRELSSSDRERQDKAIEVQEKLPEGARYSRNWL